MSLRLTVQAVGLADVTTTLEAAADRFERPRRPLFDALAAALVGMFQENINTGGARLADRGISWPALLPETRAIRRYYGHTPDRRLIRSGDLLHSFYNEAGESFASAGTRARGAFLVHSGGSITERGRTRTLVPRPFVLPSRQDADDVVAQIADHLFGAG